MDLKEALTTTSHELKTFQRRCEDQQFQLDEAILKKEELIKNLRKTEKEVQMILCSWHCYKSNLFFVFVC